MSLFGNYFDCASEFEKRFKEKLTIDPVTTGWQVSKKGNLWKEFQGVTLTILPGKYNARYVVCIAGPVKWGRKFIDLGAGNISDAINEAERKAKKIVDNDLTLGGAK